MRASQRAYCRNVQWKVQAESEGPNWFGMKGLRNATPVSGGKDKGLGQEGVATARPQN